MIRQRVAAEPWIARDEPPAFNLENPKGKAPVLLACDHASSRIPARLGTLGLSPEDRLRHIAWDIGAAEVARHLMRMLDATLVLAGYSRPLIQDSARWAMSRAMSTVRFPWRMSPTSALRNSEHHSRGAIHSESSSNTASV